MSINTDADEFSEENEAKEQQKPQKKHKWSSVRRITIEMADLQPVAEEAKWRLIADGYEQVDAEAAINAVWGKFRTRHYVSEEFEEIHKITSPRLYLAGALVSMAKYERRHETEESFRKASQEDGNRIHDLQVSVKWSAPETRINPEVDYIIGEIDEAQNRIREYLVTYPARQGRPSQKGKSAAV